MKLSEEELAVSALAEGTIKSVVARQATTRTRDKRRLPNLIVILFLSISGHSARAAHADKNSTLYYNTIKNRFVKGVISMSYTVYIII